ncbi:MAG: hypothetical protein ACSHX9_06280 [Luteolibacter sp.]
MKIPYLLAIISLAAAFTSPLQAAKENKKTDAPTKKEATLSEAEIKNEVRRIEKELEATRKKTLDAISKQEAAKDDLEAQKKTARDLQEKAAEMLKSLEAAQKSRLAAEIETQRKNTKGSDDKNMPGELTDVSSTLDLLRLKLDQTNKTDELSKELEKAKAELAKSKSAKDKAEAALRDTRKQAGVNQTKLNNANRAIEAQLKTISDLRKEAITNSEALAKAQLSLKNRDAQIKKLSENTRTPRVRSNNRQEND